MMIATFHDSLPVFGLALLGVVTCAAPLLWARWMLHGTRWALYAAAALSTALVAAIASTGELAWLLLAGAVVLAAVLARRYLGRAGRWATAALIVIAGLPLYALTAFAIVIGFAAIGCAPDAYECPL